MSRNAFIALAAVVIVGAAGWYFYSKGAASDSMMGANAATTTASGGMQSLRDLIAANISQACTYDEPQSGTKGTMYIASGKIRGDFTSGGISGHMISDGQTVNTWMDGQSRGYKMSFTAGAPANNPDAQKGVDPDKKTAYQCAPWSADQSKFQLPPNVTFMDMSAMMQGAAPAGAPAAGAQVKGTAQQCAACDSVPAAYRNQCRAALHC